MQFDRMKTIARMHFAPLTTYSKQLRAVPAARVFCMSYVEFFCSGKGVQQLKLCASTIMTCWACVLYTFQQSAETHVPWPTFSGDPAARSHGHGSQHGQLSARRGFWRGA